MRRKLHRERPDQPDHGGLARAVGGAARLAVESAIEAVASSRPARPPSTIDRAAACRVIITPSRLTRITRSQLSTLPSRNGLHQRHAGVGDADVEALVARRGSTAWRPGGSVTSPTIRRRFGDRRPRFDGVQRHDAGAVGGEPTGRGVADPRGSAGDEHMHAAKIARAAPALKVRFCPERLPTGGCSACPGSGSGPRGVGVRPAWMLIRVNLPMYPLGDADLDDRPGLEAAAQLAQGDCLALRRRALARL